VRRRILVALVAVSTVVGAGLVVSSAGPAGATTVSDEASLRAAFGDPNETQIDLAADIALSSICPDGSVGRNSGMPLVVNGHGHTVTQTCTSGVSGVFQVINGTTMTFENITITGGHTAGNGGGVSIGGSPTFIDATVSGNTASGGGSEGGGVFATGTASFTNSTVSNNSSSRDGGGVAAGDVSLTYATVAGNNAPTGANIEILSFDSIIAFGSVVALPDGGGANCDFQPAPVTTSHGYNWDDDGSCGFGAGPGDHPNGGDPLLGPLADNGGLTQTRLPQTGSPLIDAIPTASCQADGASGITTDQRGVGRPQGPGCDIGAVEVETAPSPSPAVPVEAVVRFTG
jgi:predicted outer membrane repeat protein